jgi:hypothetical protein
MKRWIRILAPVICALGLFACAADEEHEHAASAAEHASCRAGGAQCRWDAQCCSGRCYVDVGCSG